MEGVRVENFVPFTSNLHSVAFVNVKFHLPGEFRYSTSLLGEPGSPSIVVNLLL